MDISRKADAPASAPLATGSGLQVRPLPDRAGWRAAGEITLATYPVWEQTLEQLALHNDRVCHLEMSAVTFIDVAGASALAVAAQKLSAGRRIVVEQPPAVLRRLLDMFWPDLSVIEVVA